MEQLECLIKVNVQYTHVVAFLALTILQYTSFRPHINLPPRSLSLVMPKTRRTALLPCAFYFCSAPNAQAIQGYH